MNFLIAAAATFVGCLILVPLVLGVARVLGLYTVVRERQCQVFVLFGKVLLPEGKPLLGELLAGRFEGSDRPSATASSAPK